MTNTRDLISNAFENHFSFRGLELQPVNTPWFPGLPSSEFFTFVSPVGRAVPVETQMAAAGIVTTVSMSKDTVLGTDADDTLDGTSGDDLLDGGLGNDLLRGGDGEDIYIVGQGHDLVSDYGEVGEIDVVVLDGLNRSDVTIHYNESRDLLVSWDRGSVEIEQNGQAESVEFLEFDDGTRIDLRLEAFDIIGSDGDDFISYPNFPGISTGVIFGNGGHDTISGGFLDDIIVGGVGNDTLLGQNGDDTLYAGAGDDVLEGGAGSDIYYLESGNHTISEFGGSAGELDRLVLPVNSDQITATHITEGFSEGLFIEWDGGSVFINDGLDPSRAVEIIEFADGSSTRLNSLDIAFSGSDADDSISVSDFPGLEDNFVTGGAGNDRLFSAGGDDILFGGSGDDRLNGNSGDDILFGGTGTNELDGGAGSDTYLVGDGLDIIEESTRDSGKDIIKFSAAISSASFIEFVLETGRFSTGSLEIIADGRTFAIIENFDPDEPPIEFLEYSDGRREAFPEITSFRGSEDSDTIFPNTAR